MGLPLTQKQLRSVGSFKLTHENSAFFQLLSKKSATKFICVKTSSGKVVATSFPILYLMIQVAQLSLTNPRDVLHHDKRQNFKTVT